MCGKYFSCAKKKQNESVIFSREEHIAPSWSMTGKKYRAVTPPEPVIHA
jgi:hypothetical protein